jgi:Ca-activated chloride channel homolog
VTSGPDDDFDDLKAALHAATPKPDATRRQENLALAQKNFANLQESRIAARPTPEPPKRGIMEGVRKMLHTLSGKGALTLTTALVACGLLILTPQGQDLLRPLGGQPGTVTETAPNSAADLRTAPDSAPVQEAIAADSESVTGSIAEAPAAAPLLGRTEAPATAMTGAPAAEAETGLSLSAAEPAIIREEAPLMAPLPAPTARGLTPPGAIQTDDGMASAAPQNTETFANAAENPLRIVAEEPVSTFSIDVDTASYALIRQSLNAGQLPPAEAVRIEEMINYFPYDYPGPEAGEAPFRPTVTVMQTPWNPDTQLLHIGLQGMLPALEDRPPLNLVFLIDTSGSMADATKLPLLKQSFRLMLDELRPEDQVAIVEYAGSAGLVLPATAASDRQAILNALQSLGAGGSTNGQGGSRTGLCRGRRNGGRRRGQPGHPRHRRRFQRRPVGDAGVDRLHRRQAGHRHLPQRSGLWPGQPRRRDDAGARAERQRHRGLCGHPERGAESAGGSTDWGAVPDCRGCEGAGRIQPRRRSRNTG